MDERTDLLRSIAETIADYRKGDSESPTPDQEHVDRWVLQFDKDVQVPILHEMDHVLKKTYLSRSKAEKILEEAFNKIQPSDDPCAFWKRVEFLDIQGGGESQKEMLRLFDEILKKRCDFSVGECIADPQAYIYLDDGIFSGGRIYSDLEKWISIQAPDKASLYVVVVAVYKGSYYSRNKIKDVGRQSGKDIDIYLKRKLNFENRLTYRDSSDVLWPTSIPEDGLVKKYVNELDLNLRSHGKNRKIHHPRSGGNVGRLGIFSSEKGRHILEQEFLKAGVGIRKKHRNFDEHMRPLGRNIAGGIGFGSLFVTYRNCPNNAPLVLWVGEPWYPLFPRVINKETSSKKPSLKIKSASGSKDRYDEIYTHI